MENQNRLYKKILKATGEMNQKFPELNKYLPEIPEQYNTKIEDGVNNKELKDYLQSLKNIVENYAKQHPESDDTNSKQ